MLDTGELSFAVLTDNYYIDILVTRSDARDRERWSDISEEAKLLVKLIVLNDLRSLAMRRDDTEENHAILF